MVVADKPGISRKRKSGHEFNDFSDSPLRVAHLSVRGLGRGQKQMERHIGGVSLNPTSQRHRRFIVLPDHEIGMAQPREVEGRKIWIPAHRLAHQLYRLLGIAG